METAAGEDAVLRLQSIGSFGVVDVFEIHRHYAHAAVEIPRARKTNGVDVLQTVEKTLGQCHFMGMKVFYTGLVEECHGGFPAVNAGHIGRAGLKAVGHIGGQQLAVGGTAGAAGNEGSQLRGKVLAQKHGADAAGTEKSLMTGDAEGGQPEFVEIYIDMTRSLGSVQHESDAVCGADLTHALRILHRAGDVGAVRHDQQSGVGTDHAFNGIDIQKTLPVAGDAVKADAAFRELLDGAHDSIVLHAADETVIAAFEEALDDHIHAGGHTGGQNDIGGIVEMEELRKALAEGQQDKTCVLCAAVNGAVDCGTHGIEIILHALADTGGLGEGCCGIVQINRFHKNLLLVVFSSVIPIVARENLGVNH